MLRHGFLGCTYISPIFAHPPFWNFNRYTRSCVLFLSDLYTLGLLSSRSLLCKYTRDFVKYGLRVVGLWYIATDYWLLGLVDLLVLVTGARNIENEKKIIYLYIHTLVYGGYSFLYFKRLWY